LDRRNPLLGQEEKTQRYSDRLAEKSIDDILVWDRAKNLVATKKTWKVLMMTHPLLLTLIIALCLILLVC
jgi:hypothetical protein